MVRVANLALQELIQQRFELLHKHRRLKKTKLLLKAKNKSLLHLNCFISTAVLGEVLKKNYLSCFTSTAVLGEVLKSQRQSSISTL